jgi:predicted nucleic acid-binding protein
LIDMRRVVKLIRPSHIVKKLADEPDNRFPECAETARADFLITGNTALSPAWKATIIPAPRAFVDLWQQQIEGGAP